MAVVPVAAPQTLAFGPGGGLSLAVGARIRPWFTLAGELEATLLSLTTARLPEGVLAPTTPGGSLSLGAVARVEPFAAPARVTPFIELALALGISGTRFAPALAPRVGVALRFADYTIGASVGYWRLFDVAPSVLPGDGQFVTAGLELTRSFGGATIARPRAPEVRVERPASPPARVCPVLVHATTSDLDHDGCPDDDRDDDHIADPADACPDHAEDRDNFEDADGCPDPDNDRDTIADAVDRCPLAAEVINGVDDQDGCPDETLARVQGGRVLYVDQLRFFFNSIRITPDSRPVLRDIARIFTAHPEFAVIYVEGHADSIGDEHYNDRLSYLRACAIVDAIAQLGVARTRMVPVGYGQRQPVAHGEDYWRRALNRRVEFVVDGRRTPGRALTARGFVDVRAGGAQ